MKTLRKIFAAALLVTIGAACTESVVAPETESTTEAPQVFNNENDTKW